MSKSREPSASDINSLIELYSTRRYADLEGRARALVGKHPGFGFGWKLLGAALQLQGKDALQAFQKVAHLMPDDAEAHFNLGVVLSGKGRLEEAVTSYQRAVSLKPDYVEAQSNLGNALRELGRLDLAAATYRRVLELRPQYALGHFNLGNVLKQQGELARAADCYRRVLELKPDLVVAHNNLGNVLKELGQIDGAVSCFRRAVELEPNVAATHNNLGMALKDLGQTEAAIACYRRAIELEPTFDTAHNNLAICLLGLYRLDDAEDACQTALKINPNLVSALLTLGNVYKETSRIGEAVACCRRAIELDPTSIAARSNLIYLLSFYPGYDNCMILDEVRSVASAFNSIPRIERQDSVGSRTRSDRLRVGYVSPDFRTHCQSFFTIPLLSNHNHSKFEVFCYAQLAKYDDLSNRLRTYADGWRDTYLKTDQQVAEMIIDDNIDILVDLTMYMANARPKLFALKPAPVQVAWLAYPGTTGIRAIDYRLTDPWLDPPGLGDDCYSEKSMRLRDTFWCYDPLMSDLTPGALPARGNGYVTFGCLNNFSKVSSDTLHRWAKVMARVPSSRIILLSPAGRHRQRVFDVFGQYGVYADRIEFVELQPRQQYLQTYNRIDVCLDTLPYNGHTTSLDAYWMGVPVVTLVGNSVAGRAGWSQLTNLGLTELAALDEDAFLDITVRLANDIPRLTYLRESLRGKMESSPLMDGKRFAGAIETAYLKMWEEHSKTEGFT